MLVYDIDWGDDPLLTCLDQGLHDSVEDASMIVDRLETISLIELAIARRYERLVREENLAGSDTSPDDPLELGAMEEKGSKRKSLLFPQKERVSERNCLKGAVDATERWVEVMAHDGSTVAENHTDISCIARMEDECLACRSTTAKRTIDGFNGKRKRWSSVRTNPSCRNDNGLFPRSKRAIITSLRWRLSSINRVL